MARIDVIVVSYNSADQLRGCVEAFVGIDGVQVLVVDNDSSDGSLDTLAGLPVMTIPAGANRGFAHGCNLGLAHSDAPFVLFLNPDARIDRRSLEALAQILEDDPKTGAAAPKILGEEGDLHHSVRREARLASTYARAFFLHRVLPSTAWSDEVIRDPSVYERAGDVEWASGACLLVRKAALEQAGWLDERFFLYREDMDLCRRLREAGYRIRFEPRAVVTHVGGASAPRPELFAVLAVSRILYADKHRSRPAAIAERAGVALEALTHVVISKDGLEGRRGHARALLAAFAPRRWDRAAARR